MGLRNFFLVSLLWRIPQYDSYVFNYDVCGNDEDAKPPVITNPDCWRPSTFPPLEDCDCGEGYNIDYQGKCKGCREGYSRNEDHHCVHCPDKRERWCRAFEKCICHENFHRVNGICVPCGVNEESNGRSDCICKDYFSRNKEGKCGQCGDHEIRDHITMECECSDSYVRNSQGKCEYCSIVTHQIKYVGNVKTCVCEDGYQEDENGYCEVIPKEYSTKTVVFGFLAVAFLGVTCGYVIRQYKKS
ncbi:hypothetical protein ACLKA7_002303 [Drosophila subpalustris]